jgi:hypothetical protein
MRKICDLFLVYVSIIDGSLTGAVLSGVSRTPGILKSCLLSSYCVVRTNISWLFLFLRLLMTRKSTFKNCNEIYEILALSYWRTLRGLGDPIKIITCFNISINLGDPIFLFVIICLNTSIIITNFSLRFDVSSVNKSYWSILKRWITCDFTILFFIFSVYCYLLHCSDYITVSIWCAFILYFVSIYRKIPNLI